MSPSAYRINPDRNQPWNELPLLPIDRELYYTMEVVEQLGNTKAALARLQGRGAAIPNQGVLINTISLQEAKASSAIENIFTTDDELYKAYSEQGSDLPAQEAPKEVLKYREALWAGQEDLENKDRFDKDYFIQLYQEIKETSEGIRPEISRTNIKQSGSGPNAGSVVYTPPRGKKVIEEKLDNLIAFINDDETCPEDPLLKMAIAHYQFEAIHPFRDGNGRVGRIFNINYLTFQGLLELPILSLSRYIIEHKEEYYDLLAGVSQRGNWKDWIIYMLKAVETTSNLTYGKVNDIIEAKETIQRTIEQETDLRLPGQLTDLLFHQPFTKVKHLVENNLYAENTARKYLHKLCEMEILEKRNLQGKDYFLNLELYRILSQ